MLLLLALLSLPAARAACVVSQTSGSDGIEFDVDVDGTCPNIAIIADRNATVQAWTRSGGFTEKLPKDQIVAHPWGLPALGWRITAPLLAKGDRLITKLTWTSPSKDAPHVDLRLDGSAPTLARGGTAQSTWIFVASRHPEWGFTDPKFGRFERKTDWVFGEDGEAGWLDGLRADGAGGWWPGGAGTVTTTSIATPAPALGEVALPPGSLAMKLGAAKATMAATLLGAGQAVADDVIARVPSGGFGGIWIAEAPAGGLYRWRVESAGGVGVVADDVAFVAGLDAHFRVASLNEPAVPMALRGERDLDKVLHALWDDVREPPRGLLGDASHPRLLNRAWHSGWLTDGERALVLLRFLGQERIAARWVLAGTAPDPFTYSGYDHLLVAAQLPDSNQVIWLDPSCASCALGEIDPALSGQVAVGGADHAPLLPGSLTLSAEMRMSDAGDPIVYTTVTASGNAVRWLRARVPDGNAEAVARVFGAVAPTQIAVTGWVGDTVTVAFASASSPRPVALPRFGG